MPPGSYISVPLQCVSGGGINVSLARRLVRKSSLIAQKAINTRNFDSAPGYHFFLHAQNYRIFTLTPIIDGLSHSDFAFLKLNLRTFQKTPFVRFGSIAVIQPMRVRASLNVCSTPGAPLWLNWFHRCVLRIILLREL